jgi:hypothetical protein
MGHAHVLVSFQTKALGGDGLVGQDIWWKEDSFFDKAIDSHLYNLKNWRDDGS